MHSGDSACSIPTQSIPSTTLKTIREWTVKVAKALKVVGLINIQYAIQVRLLLCYAVAAGLGGVRGSDLATHVGNEGDLACYPPLETATRQT